VVTVGVRDGVTVGVEVGVAVDVAVAVGVDVRVAVGAGVIVAGATVSTARAHADITALPKIIVKNLRKFRRESIAD
jgi:hypothetical protein